MFTCALRPLPLYQQQQQQQQPLPAYTHIHTRGEEKDTPRTRPSPRRSLDGERHSCARHAAAALCYYRRSAGGRHEPLSRKNYHTPPFCERVRNAREEEKRYKKQSFWVICVLAGSGACGLCCSFARGFGAVWEVRWAAVVHGSCTRARYIIEKELNAWWLLR